MNVISNCFHGSRRAFETQQQRRACCEGLFQGHRLMWLVVLPSCSRDTRSTGEA